MAFNKKPLKAQDELIPYSVGLEDRVESGFEATKIESGSNSNGSWTKFPDGTLLQRKSNMRTDNGTAYNLSIYWNFPTSFVNTDYQVLPTLLSSTPSNAQRDIFMIGGKSTTRALVTLHDESGRYVTDVFADFDVIAIGRWK